MTIEFSFCLHINNFTTNLKTYSSNEFISSDQLNHELISEDIK